MRDAVKVVVAKVGLDGHDRGAKAVALAMRDAGFEVIYTGLRQTPEMVVNTALQEDADVIGVSLLSGAHIEIMTRIGELLAEHGMADDIVVVLGGNVPTRHHQRLHGVGVDGIFPTDSKFTDVAEWIREAVQERRSRRTENA